MTVLGSNRRWTYSSIRGATFVYKYRSGFRMWKPILQVYRQYVSTYVPSATVYSTYSLFIARCINPINIKRYGNAFYTCTFLWCWSRHIYRQYLRIALHNGITAVHNRCFVRSGSSVRQLGRARSIPPFIRLRSRLISSLHWLPAFRSGELAASICSELLCSVLL